MIRLHNPRRHKPHIYYSTLIGEWLILDCGNKELDDLAIQFCYEQDERS